MSAGAPAPSVAIAQCLPYGKHLTYWPLRGVLFRLASIPERASSAEARECIRGWLKTSGLDHAERAAELLAATIGAAEAEAADRTALLSAWRTTLEHAARARPLVVVFEDLHWSSDSLLDLVEFVMQPHGDLPLLMIALARPELLDRRPAWGGGRRNHVALMLEPLSDDAVTRLVEHLLGTEAPEVVSRVVTRAEGNPFFAGELVRVLLARIPALEDADGVEAALASLPDTVHATVLARLDMLNGHERRALQLGSVLGRTFRSAELAALGLGAEESSRAVNSLVDKDLVRPAASADVFVFRHILIREVAYQMLSRRERARLHADAGAWYEEFAKGREDEFAELIAYHYREAASLAGSLEAKDDLARIRRKASSWLVRAYEVALSGAAEFEAMRHVRAAIEFAEPQDLALLYEKLGDALPSEAAVEAYRTALRLFREQGRPEANRELRLLSGALYTVTRWTSGTTLPPAEEEMTRLREEARQLSGRATDDRALARYLMGEAFYPHWRASQGRPPTGEMLRTAAEAGERALAIAERLDDARLQSAALDAIGSVAAYGGDLHAQRETGRRRLKLGERLGVRELIDALGVVAWDSVLLGELDEAITVSREGLARVHPGQVPGAALGLASWYTLATFLRGLWDETTAGGERMLQLWEEWGRAFTTGALRGFEAARAVARARGDTARDERLRDAMLEITRADRDPGGGAALRRALATGEPPTDETLRFAASPWSRGFFLDRLLAVLCDRGTPPAAALIAELEAMVAPSSVVIAKAQLARARGIAEADVTSMTSALVLFERVCAVPYAARSRCERALLLHDAAEYALGARALEELGDAEQLERYERRRV